MSVKTKKAGTSAKMDLANRALCFAYRNPPKGMPKMKYEDLQKLVRKTDGSIPSVGGDDGMGFDRKRTGSESNQNHLTQMQTTTPNKVIMTSKVMAIKNS